MCDIEKIVLFIYLSIMVTLYPQLLTLIIAVHLHDNAIQGAHNRSWEEDGEKIEGKQNMSIYDQMITDRV